MQAFLPLVMSILAEIVVVKNSGIADEAREKLGKVVEKATKSLLGPQDDGTPWTEDAILAWHARHQAVIDLLKERHQKEP